MASPSTRSLRPSFRSIGRLARLEDLGTRRRFWWANNQRRSIIGYGRRRKLPMWAVKIGARAMPPSLLARARKSCALTSSKQHSRTGVGYLGIGNSQQNFWHEKARPRPQKAQQTPPKTTVRERQRTRSELKLRNMRMYKIERNIIVISGALIIGFAVISAGINHSSLPDPCSAKEQNGL
jgi:hypothetical protein